MEIKIIKNKETLMALKSSNEKIIHIAFRPSDKDIFMVMTKFKKLKMITIPKSYFITLSKTTKELLKYKKIKLVSLKLSNDMFFNRYYETE